MIQHHTTLVDSSVDVAGSVDVNLEYAQLYADQATDALNTDPTYASSHIDLLNRAVGAPQDRTKMEADNPIMHFAQLAGLKAAVIVHADGDEVVPYSASMELAGDLKAENVPTKIDTLIPLGNQTPCSPPPPTPGTRPSPSQRKHSPRSAPSTDPHPPIRPASRQTSSPPSTASDPGS